MKKKQLKICFVLPGTYSFFKETKKNTAGGAELQMYSLSKKLAQNRNFKVSFIVGDYKQNKIEFIDNIKLIKSFNAKRNDKFIKKLIQAINFIKILINEKPEIIISTTNNTMVVLCSLYSIFSKSKHIHRIAHNKDTSFGRTKEFGILARIYSWGMKKADKIFVQNTEQQQNLLQNFNKKSILFRNVFPIKKQIQSIKKHILWVSRYQKWKQAELFVNLSQKIPNFEFVIICPAPSKKLEINWLKLKQKVETISNIIFIDYVPFHDIQVYFNKAIAFVNTSDFEGFPNTFLQAMQGKTPIISLNVNPDNFIDEYNCGIFCNNNFDSLLKKTGELLHNKEELKTKGENAFKYLKENHDINIIGKQLEEIIINL